MKISYLGPKNTYTEQAATLLAEKIQGEVELVEEHSLESIAKSVSSKETEKGVLPHYNYLEGLVQESLDLIYENGLFINDLQRLLIELSAGVSRSNNEDAVAVYSHPKALAQCSDWLWEKYGDIEKIPMDSTAAAARHVAKTGSGIAISNYPALKENGLEIMGRDIGNEKNNRSNFTDFYLVSRERENGKIGSAEAVYAAMNDPAVAGMGISSVPYPINPMNLASIETEEGADRGENYLTMLAITPHHDEAGLLAGILNQVAYYNLNIAKIHSRPALDDFSEEEYGKDLEPQMFYLEIMTHQDNEDFKRCVDSLEYKLGKDLEVEIARVLGSYEKPAA